MEEFHFIELEDVEYFFEEEMKCAGTKAWVRDQFELEACIESPKHTFGSSYLLDIYGMAAKYIVSFSIRHPFTDGNKRIGAICAVVFLEANGYDYREGYEGELAEVIYKFLRNEVDEAYLSEYFKVKSNTN